MRLWSWLRRSQSHRPLTVAYGAGWLCVDDRDLVQRAVFCSGAYEPEVWETLSDHAVGDEVLWDVGAHIGTVSVRAQLDRRFRLCLAFEPDPDRYAVLLQNLRMNGGESRARAYPWALGEGPASLRLYRGPPANTGLSSLAHPVSADSVGVVSRSIDNLVLDHGFPSPTLVKIDVEDWEDRVLRGAERLFGLRPPRAVVFEAATGAHGPADARISAFFSRHGYSVRRVVRPGGILDARENYLAVHGRTSSA
jgi:FkbM family methyltransferase